MGLRDGMAVLEPGAGPGFITEQFLRLLPHSEITIVERDPVMVAQAQRYLAGKGIERVHFVTASVLDTGLPADTFDFAYARLIFQHLPNPAGAAREIWRVLKPGGRLVITDFWPGVYAGHLRARGLLQVQRRPLGWRFWYLPGVGAGLVTATKSSA